MPCAMLTLSRLMMRDDWGGEPESIMANETQHDTNVTVALRLATLNVIVEV